MRAQRQAGSRLESVASWLLVVAAVSMAVAVVHREIGARSSAAGSERSAKLRFVKDWQALDARAIPVGDTSGKIKLYEFADLECPACRAFHLTGLSAVSDKYGSRVSVRFLHFPLSIHRFARPAAIAAECADQQGRFGEFVKGIYSQQDSLGLKPWGSYAAAAGIADTTAFVKCTRTPMFARIDSGLTFGRRIKILGTPTVVVNGWQFPSPPAPEVLSRVIDEIIAGRDPRSAYDAAR